MSTNRSWNEACVAVRTRRIARPIRLSVLGLLLVTIACGRGPTAPTPLSTTPAASVGSVPTSRIVNLDSKVNNAANPVEILLEAGSYTVTPVGTAQGGAWDAWNAWGPTSCADATGCPFELPRKTGWIHSYEVRSSHLDNVTVDGRPLSPSSVMPSGTRSYFFKSGSSGHYEVVADRIFPDASIALAAAYPSTFTIASAGMVEFLIPDQTPSDNVGGVSLLVASQ